MKDIRGRDIKAGDHVVYIRSVSNKSYEEGIVVVCKDDYIQIDYMGWGDGVFATKTRRGRIAATTKKIIVLNDISSQVEYVDIFNKERTRFDKEIKKIQVKLTKVLEVGEALAVENEELRAEVNKIHNRWSILDIREENG